MQIDLVKAISEYENTMDSFFQWMSENDIDGRLIATAPFEIVLGIYIHYIAFSNISILPVHNGVIVTRNDSGTNCLIESIKIDADVITLYKIGIVESFKYLNFPF